MGMPSISEGIKWEEWDNKHWPRRTKIGGLYVFENWNRSNYTVSFPGQGTGYKTFDSLLELVCWIHECT